MKSGDVVRLGGKLREYIEGSHLVAGRGKSWVEHNTKDDVIVAFVIGIEKKTEPSDPDHWLAVMNSHGFIRTDQLTEEEWKVIKTRIEAKLAEASKCAGMGSGCDKAPVTGSRYCELHDPTKV